MSGLTSELVYTLADLQKLYKDKSYKEGLAHMKDIAPTNRDKQWTDLLQNLATGYLSSLKNGKTNYKAMVFMDQILDDHPSLSNAKEFMRMRAELGLEIYQVCFQYNDFECYKEFISFVRRDSSNFDIKYKIAKEVRKRMSDAKSIPFFAEALKGQNKEYCKDEDLKLALKAGLSKDTNTEEAKSAQEVAFGECFQELISSIKEAIKESDNAKKLACKTMIKKNALSGIAKKKCQNF